MDLPAEEIASRASAGANRLGAIASAASNEITSAAVTEEPTANRSRTWVSRRYSRQPDGLVRLAAIDIWATTSEDALRLLRRRLRQRRQTVLFFANAHFLEKCRALCNMIARDKDILVVNDGLAVNVAARLVHGSGFQENLNGTDFVPSFLATLPRGTRVYLLGAAPDVVTTAGIRFGRLPGVQVVGCRDGYSLWDHEDEVLRDIAAKRPQVILVGLGNPAQEQWILAHKDRLPASVIIGVGALFDFVAGHVRRAPFLIRRLRLEWAYRLSRDPRRLVPRYTVGMLRFFALVMMDHWRRKRRPAPRRDRRRRRRRRARR
jgi:beta-1,4-glucosyltransferase